MTPGIAVDGPHAARRQFCKIESGELSDLGSGELNSGRLP
jgi:hypothetical protein